jgi:uncharacterized protein YqeY
MSIKDEIRKRMTTAMRTGDRKTRLLWSTVLSELQNAEKSGRDPRGFDDAAATAFLRSQIKQRAKSAAEYRAHAVAGTPAGDRALEHADAEEEEAAVINEVLPAIESDRARLKTALLAVRDRADRKAFGHAMGVIARATAIDADAAVTVADDGDVVLTGVVAG